MVVGDIGAGLLKNLPNFLSQEKDGLNMPSLLEFILLVLSLGLDKMLDLSLLIKHMCKCLKKACYGATADLWAPIMLPMVSVLSDETHVLSVLTSLVRTSRFVLSH